MKSENLNFSEKDVADIRRKVFVIWWNVLGFYKTFAAPNQPITRPTTVPKDPMDRWLVSAVQSLIQTVTQHFDNYDVIRASRALMEFINELSTWYLRLSRDRIKDPTQTETSQVFGYALYTVAQLMAPLAPFFAELVHQELSDVSTSVHLTDWPTVDEALLSVDLNAEMQEVQQLVEAGHAERKNQSLKVRQPLASVTFTVPKLLKHQGEFAGFIQSELNVKEVIWKESATDQAPIFDLNLTPELKAEGEARELMRQIQNLRKQAGYKAGQTAKVQLPSWPEAWKTEIERKTTSTLQAGETLQLLES